MVDVRTNLEQVLKRIEEAERQYNRPPGSVRLVAVSKTKPIQLISEAIDAGQQIFGENYVQEAVDKITQINNQKSNDNLQWHFIGPIQSNKTKLIAENFLWVHGVERAKIAQRLSEQRPADLPALNICIQVNVSEESSKAGVSISELSELVQSIVPLTRIRLRGFMAIPGRESDFQKQRKPFKLLKDTMREMNQQFSLSMDTLSMGMSNDLEAAIAEGATFVRVGTDIFGAREYKE